MKTLKTAFFSLLFISIATISFAQTKTEKIKVWGECTTCQLAIEKAAKSAGASYASWDWESKMLTVKYNNKSATNAKIQKAVAKIGYDTKDIKAEDEVYDNLHYCCKYERTRGTGKAETCCIDANCVAAGCEEKKVDDKGEKACCKEAGCEKIECIKNHNP